MFNIFCLFLEKVFVVQSVKNIESSYAKKKKEEYNRLHCYQCKKKKKKYHFD